MAIRAGGKESREPQDHGWMYGRTFEDIDGHLWEAIFTDESAMKNDGKASWQVSSEKSYNYLENQWYSTIDFNVLRVDVLNPDVIPHVVEWLDKIMMQQL
jgi:dsRNA-specific ribonuclease